MTSVNNDEFDESKWLYIDTKTVKDLCISMNDLVIDITKLRKEINDVEKSVTELKIENESLKKYIEENRDIHTRNDDNIQNIKDMITENRITHKDNNDVINEIKKLLDENREIYTKMLKNVTNKEDFEKIKPFLDRVKSPYMVPRIKNMAWRMHNQPVCIGDLLTL